MNHCVPTFSYFAIMEIIAVLTTFLPIQTISKSVSKHPENLNIYSHKIRRKHKKNPKYLILWLFELCK